MPPEKFRANVMTSSGSLSLVFGELMKQNKFFEQMDVDATPLPVSDGAKVIAALVVAARTCAAGAGFAACFPAMEKGAKIKILSAAGISPVTAIFTKNPGDQIGQGSGGQIGRDRRSGALLHELVVALCIKKGVDHTKITFVNVGSGPDVFKAIIAGTVDAGPSEIDFYYHQDKYGVRALDDALLWNELPEFTNQAMFASDQAIAEKREALVRCMAAYCKMYRFVQIAGWRRPGGRHGPSRSARTSPRKRTRNGNSSRSPIASPPIWR